MNAENFILHALGYHTGRYSNVKLKIGKVLQFLMKNSDYKGIFTFQII